MPSSPSLFLIRKLAPLALSIVSVHASAQGVDVPLERLPNGPLIGATAGASFLDYDGDGWIDFYINANASLWRNEQGAGWTKTADLDQVLPPFSGLRYGAACGDFDNDGLPDIATEPRGDCFTFLQNLGGGPNFVEVAGDPTVVMGQPCAMYAETGSWADVDDDGDLDLVVTAYPDSVQQGSGGNRFWENLGPVGPNGGYQLLLDANAGLTNPANVERPEGAQFCDVDRDGDVDFFANHTVYQNRSLRGDPAFVALNKGLTGFSFTNVVDEGAFFFDYDLDGDQDLLVLYTGQKTRLWANQGDATFDWKRQAIEDSQLGASEGCSAEDWDLDGDLDLSTAEIFRRNLLVETGTPFLRLATHNIPPNQIGFASPTWGDWDHDGDPDCILANWRAASFLFRNTTYDDTTPHARRLSIRVRVVRDSPTVPRGLETEFGATVELVVRGDTSGFVRRRFVASAHGYLQQSEYALPFALPPGPDPEAPAEGVSFALRVDFPSLPAQGILRIDSTVNPALEGLELADLEDREITIYRSGKAVIGGIEHPPRVTDLSPRLTTTTGGLALATLGKPLPDPVPAPASDWFAGIDVDTTAASGPVLVQELVLDGELAPPRPASDDANVVLWDVTSDRPRRVQAETLATSPANHRSFLSVSWRLFPNRHYRVVCRVSELRGSPITGGPGGSFDEPVKTNGGLSYQDLDPRSGLGAKTASVDPTQVYLALRFRAPRR